jgi:hypothetical protein
LNRADAAQAQLLDEPVLQRQMRTLDAALGRTAVRTPRVNVELVHRAAKLRDAVAGGCRTRAAEHARAVAVESDWLAVRLKVAPHRHEVAEGRFARGEVQGHQPAGRVIHIHQQRTGRRPVLEPAMIAAVDLHQFIETRAPGARLVDLRWALFAWHPQAGFGHQVPHGFLR